MSLVEERMRLVEKKMQDSNEDQLLTQLNEGRFIDGAILLVLTARLLKPFKTWKAYKMGIIDKNGNVIKPPEKHDEKEAWTLLDRFLAKIKKFFIKNKFIGTLLTYWVMMKEDVEIQDDSVEYLVEQKQKESRVRELSYKIRNEIMKEGFEEDEYYKMLANLQVKDVINEQRGK